MSTSTKVTENEKVSTFSNDLPQPLKIESPDMGNPIDSSAGPFRGTSAPTSAMSPILFVEAVNADFISETLLFSAQNILRNLRGNLKPAILERVNHDADEPESAFATVVSSSPSSPFSKSSLNPTDSPENSAFVPVIGKLIMKNSKAAENLRSYHVDKSVACGYTDGSPMTGEIGTCVAKLSLEFCQQRENDAHRDHDAQVRNRAKLTSGFGHPNNERCTASLNGAETEPPTVTSVRSVVASIQTRCEVGKHVCEPTPALPISIDMEAFPCGVMDFSRGREYPPLPNKMPPHIMPNDGTLPLMVSNACYPFSNHDLPQPNHTVGTFSRKRSADQFNRMGRRPLPDQSAFDLPSSLNTTSPSSRSFLDTPFTERDSCQITPHDSTNYLTDLPLDYFASIHDSSELSFAKAQLLQPDSNLAANVPFPSSFDDVYLLDSGSTADVYRVKDKGGGTHYTVKKIKERYKSDRERNIMWREILNLEKVCAEQCRHTIHLVRAWEENGHIFILTDYAERGSVAHLIHTMDLNEQRFDDLTVWHILHDVSRGLQHIHECGLVHLDIKPANLLIYSEGVVKIGDFGLAVNAGSSEEDHEGDMRYMAPEVLTSSDRNPPADIFSLALTLYEICKTAESGVDRTTGKWGLPFEGSQWQQLRKGDLCSNLLQGRGKALSTTLRAAMHPDPTHRPSLSSILHMPDLILSMTRPDPTLQRADWPTAHPTLSRVRSFNNLMDELPDKHFSSFSRESS